MFDPLKEKLSHLTVNQIGEAVATDFASRNIPLVASEVGSGRTTLLPVLCAEAIDELIYVLLPTRFRVNQTYETLVSILDESQRNLIGRLNTKNSEENSITHSDNRVVFTTVGYALSSGIIKTATNIIFDDAHETTIMLSLAKAVIHSRIQQGEFVRVALFSAAVNLSNETAYWGEKIRFYYVPNAENHHNTIIHEPLKSIGTSVLSLIEDHHRRGILVFVANKEEIDKACVDIRQSLRGGGLTEGLDYELATIFGGSTIEARKKAITSPTCKVKILVGTNILESDHQFRWVDGGVSSGETVVLHVQCNIHRLRPDKLSLWRLYQQIKQTNRFKDGVFILADQLDQDSRPRITEPDITRLPVTELIIQSAKFPNIKLSELQFSPNEQVDERNIQVAARRLVDYGFIVQTSDQFILTADGKLIENIPLSYKSLAALCEANRLDMIPDLLPLVALLECGDMRHIYREPLGYGAPECCDYLAQLKTIANIRNGRDNHTASFKTLAENNNLNLKKYREFNNILDILTKKTGVLPQYSLYLEETSFAFEQAIKQLIFRAQINERYEYSSVKGRVNDLPVGSAKRFGTALSKIYDISVSKHSTVFSKLGATVKFCTGDVQLITPKQGNAFKVLSMATLFTTTDVDNLITRFGKDMVDPDNTLLMELPTPIIKTGDRRRPNSSYHKATTQQNQGIGSFGNLLEEAIAKHQ